MILSRLGIRGQLLIAPALVLALMTVLGAESYQRLDGAANNARASASEIGAVELLRDANSEQFEADRFQFLALRANSRATFDAQRAAAADVMNEAIAGFQEFARRARTPELRSAALGQADLLTSIQRDRERALTTAAPAVGRSLPADATVMITSVEQQVELADAANDKMVTAEQRVTDGIARDAQASAADGKRLIAILLALALLLAIAVSFALARPLVCTARRLLAAARGIAAGDLDQRVDGVGSGELGATASAFEDMIDYLRTMERAGRRIADGDLSVDVAPRSQQDALGHAFQDMSAGLRRMIGDVATTAATVRTSSEEVARTSGEAGRAVGEVAGAMGEITVGAELQLRVVGSAARSAGDMAHAVDAAAEAARESAEAAAEARGLTRDGLAAAEEATAAMQAVRDASVSASDAIGQLESKSTRIGSIVQRITEIADRTNLLALNAAIEAARAGEHGRGFAVVADEVRHLAENASGAAGEIGGLVAEMQRETRTVVAIVADGAARTLQGSGTVERTRGAFERIDGAIARMDERISQVAEAARVGSAGAHRLQAELQEVAGAAERSTAASQQISASTEETTGSTQQIAASAQCLQGNATELHQLVARFRLT